MNRRTKLTAFAAAIVWLMIAVATVSADSPRPACDRGDANSVCQANVTVFVFVDRAGRDGCDLFYDHGTDVPVEGARITFVMPDNSRVQRVTGYSGFLSLPSVNFLPGDEAFIEIEYPALYRGTSLVPCPSSPVRRRVTPETFGPLGATRIHFCAGQHVPAPASLTQN